LCRCSKQFTYPYSTALARGLLPRRAELDGAGEDAVIGGLVARLVRGLDGRLGVDAEGLDRAAEGVARFGEGADGRHGKVSCLSFGTAPITALMAIYRPERSTTQRSRPQHGGGRQAGGFLVSRGMAALPPGEESRRTPLRLRRSRRSRRSVRSSHERSCGSQARTDPETAWRLTPCAHTGRADSVA